MSDVQDRTKKTVFADTPTKRFLKLSGMSARVAGKVAGHKLANAVGRQTDSAVLYEALGEDILSTLGQMKGAAMKVGQIASQMSHLFPDEIAEKLQQLQHYAEPMPYELMAKSIRDSLGFSPEQLFRRFELEPFAAASIGQVYRAVTHQGDEVVVKVQYPGVKRSCQSDLVQLKRLFKLSGLIQVDQAALDEVFEVVQSGLMSELDYRQEAQNLADFAAFHQHNDAIVIPKVYQDLSSETVLTLAYEAGDKLSDLDRLGYSQDLKNQLALTWVESVLQEVVQFGRAHCDPHPGNFAFRKNGQVIIYDYGFVADMQDVVIDKYLDLYEAASEGRFADIDAILISLDAKPEGSTPLDPAIYEDWYQCFFQPILEENNLVDILARLQVEIEAHMAQFQSMRGVFKPCAITIFINRILGGHLLNLAQMGATCDLKPLFADYFYEPA